MQKYKTILNKKTQLTPDVFLFDFKLTEPKELIFLPGQYMILDVPQPGGGVVKRLYSIASSPDSKNNFELFVKIVENGIGTNYLKNLEEGEEVNFMGPAGVFKLKNDNKDKVFFATGTGLAPLRSIIKTGLKGNDFKFKVFLFWGLQKFSDICLFEELKQIAKDNPNFYLKICLSREEKLDSISESDRCYFTLGRVTKGLEESINNYKLTASNLEFYLCGNREVIESLKSYISSLGVGKESVVFEKY